MFMFEKMPMLIEKPEALESNTERVLFEKEKEIITSKSKEIKGEKRRKFIKNAACLLAGLMLSTSLAFDGVKIKKTDLSSLKETLKMEEVLKTENEEEQTVKIKQEIKKFNQELQALPEVEENLYQLEISQSPQLTSEILRPQSQEKGDLPNEGVIHLTGGGTQTIISEGSTDNVLSETISSFEKYQVKEIKSNQKINWGEKKIIQGSGSSKAEAVTYALQNASDVFINEKDIENEETEGQTGQIMSTEIKNCCSLIQKYNSYLKYKVVGIEEPKEKDSAYKVKLEVSRGEINL